MKKQLKMFGAISLSCISANSVISCGNPPRTVPTKKPESIIDVLTHTKLGYIYTDHEPLASEQQLKNKIKQFNPNVNVNEIKTDHITNWNALVKGDDLNYWGEVWIYFNSETFEQKTQKMLKDTEISYKSGKSFAETLDLGTFANKNLQLIEDKKVIAESTDGWKEEWSSQEWRDQHLDSTVQHIAIATIITDKDIEQVIGQKIKVTNKNFEPQNLLVKAHSDLNSDTVVIMKKEKLFATKFLYTSSEKFNSCSPFFTVTELQSMITDRFFTLPNKETIKFKFQTQIFNNLNES